MFTWDAPKSDIMLLVVTSPMFVISPVFVSLLFGCDKVLSNGCLLLVPSILLNSARITSTIGHCSIDFESLLSLLLLYLSNSSGNLIAIDISYHASTVGFGRDFYIKKYIINVRKYIKNIC